MNEINLPDDLNRRAFLKNSSLSTLMMLMGPVALRAQEGQKPAAATAEEKLVGPPINCAVIGCGARGKEILETLARLPQAQVVAVCDTYEPFLRRIRDTAPKAEKIQDFRQVLDKKEVQAVIVATPTHQHRQLVIPALQAGKHVYCESPLAHTIDDARAIALAAKNARKVNFQAGQQLRSDPQRHFLLDFVRTGAMGRTVMARAQWHKKQSWRRAAPNPAREQAMNWRLSKATSIGLMGEIGLHQLDMVNWFLNARPVSVTGFGDIVFWKDGRDVPDTVQGVFEYPNSIRLVYDCTLGNSFDGDYEMYHGTDAALMVRDNKAWMFKEVDSPLLGWEVYARKDSFYKETGIALVANATKLTAQGDAPVVDEASLLSPLYFALEAFVRNTHTIQAGVEDFLGTFTEPDNQAIAEYLGTLSKSLLPAAGYQIGYEATVTAIKAHEAVMTGSKITFQKEWFELA